jgi:AcrR family transcriptional regulator
VHDEIKACLSASQPRDRLLEAGQSLFSDQGYAATSMRQVAEKAGLALGSVYNHFQSKEAIFQAILMEFNPFTRCNVRPLSENFDRIQAKTLLAELEKQPEFFNLILIELLEFKGQHLPQLFENISGHLPPSESWRTLLGLVISYRTTQILLANTLPNGMQPKISPEAVLDFILNSNLAPE